MISTSSQCPTHEGLTNSDLTAILPTHIEAVTPRESSVSYLSDQALAAGGLVAIQGWIRTVNTPNARRVRKSREKKREAGIHQLNLEVPAEIHGTLRAVAKATIDQRQRIEAILAPPVTPTEQDLVRRRRLSAVTKASPATLAKIDAVLRSASLDAKQQKQADAQAREQLAMETLGRAIASLAGWRRWLVQIAVKLPNGQRGGTSNGRTQ